MVRAIKQGKLKLGHGAAVIQTILLRLDNQNSLNQSLKSSKWSTVNFQSIKLGENHLNKVSLKLGLEL